MSIPETDWERAVEVLRGAGEVALACHVDPDGDALGSMLAMLRYLESRGTKVWASYGAPTADGAGGPMLVPPQYTFLPGLDRLVPEQGFPASPSVLVAFDTASVERLGSLAPSARAAAEVVVLDHHPSGAAFGDVALVDGDAAATACLVDELIGRMGGELDTEMATCLYVGLITDTARFQSPTTTPDVMRFAARLLAQGIDHTRISRQVWETHSFGYLKVLGRALDRAALVADAGLAWTAVFQTDLDDLGITMAETEGLIDVLRAVEAAECTLVCKEQSDGRWRASMRSKGVVDVGRVAATLGGGGHAFSAGFLAQGTLSELVDRVVAAVGDQDAVPMTSPAR